MPRRFIQNIENILQTFSFVDVDTVNFIRSGVPDVMLVFYSLDQVLGGALQAPILEQEYY